VDDLMGRGPTEKIQEGKRKQNGPERCSLSVMIMPEMGGKQREEGYRQQDARKRYSAPQGKDFTEAGSTMGR